jgi:hypothetical protein
MALYGLTGVLIDENGQIVRARMQRVDGATGAWLGQPGEFEAAEIANSIATGDEVYSIFIIPGGSVHGPKFRQVIYENGTEGIELEEDIEGRRIQDLILF